MSAEQHWDGEEGRGGWFAALIHNVRLRGLAFQATLLIIVALSLYFGLRGVDGEVRHTLGTLLSAPVDFDLLETAGSYLVGYQRGRSTGFDLLWIGLLNAFFLTVLCGVSAAVIGLCAGLMLSSSNIVLRAAAKAFVALFRHLPLLLLGLVVYALLRLALPPPRAPVLDVLGVATFDWSGLRAPFPDAAPGGGALWILLLSVFVLWRALLWWSRLRKDWTGRGFPATTLALALLIGGGAVAYWLAGYEAAKQAPAWYEADFEARGRVLDDPRTPGGVTFPETASVTAILRCAPIGKSGEPVLVARVAGIERFDVLILGRYHADRAELRSFDLRFANCEQPLWLAPLRWEQPLQIGRSFARGYGAVVPLEILAVWAALALHFGAYLAEILRAGWRVVGSGQREAAAAIGLRPAQAFSQVLLPLAWRAARGPVVSQYLTLAKTACLASAVAYIDLVKDLAEAGAPDNAEDFARLLLALTPSLVFSILIWITLIARRRRDWGAA